MLSAAGDISSAPFLSTRALLKNHWDVEALKVQLMDLSLQIQRFYLRHNLMVTTKLGGKREAVASADKERSPQNREPSNCLSWVQQPLKPWLKSPPEIKSDSSSGWLPSLTKLCVYLCAKDRAESCFEGAGQVGGKQGQGAGSQGQGGSGGLSPRGSGGGAVG